MEIKQNPFSLYDFLGYFVPGALFFMGLTTIPLLSNPSTNLANDILNSLDQVSFYLTFILIAYLIGHILSFVSSLTIENYSNWKVGYPSRYLLGEPYPKYMQSKSTEHKTERKLMHAFVWVLLFPITFWDITIGNVFHLDKLLYARPLDPLLIKIIKGKLKVFSEKYAGLSAEDINTNETGDFRFSYHYAVEHAPAHFPKMQNYVALYGFTRTITMVIVLLFWWILILFVLEKTSFWDNLPMLAFLSAFSFISFLNFMKFYRRFSLEVMMAVAATLPDAENKDRDCS
jgi:hypothetical protein